MIVALAAMVATIAATGCTTKKQWGDEEREKLRKELKGYRDMVYLDNLGEVEFYDFSGDVVEAIEYDYPVYTTFIEMPGRGDTVDVYVVSTIVEELDTDPHNLRNIYPYPYLVSEGMLPAGLTHQAQRAFYECLSHKIKNYYPSTAAFFDAVMMDGGTPTAVADMQMQCAQDLFDWGIEVDEMIIID